MKKLLIFCLLAYHVINYAQEPITFNLILENAHSSEVIHVTLDEWIAEFEHLSIPDQQTLVTVVEETEIMFNESAQKAIELFAFIMQAKRDEGMQNNTLKHMQLSACVVGTLTTISSLLYSYMQDVCNKCQQADNDRLTRLVYTLPGLLVQKFSCPQGAITTNNFDNAMNLIVHIKQELFFIKEKINEKMIA